MRKNKHSKNHICYGAEIPIDGLFEDELEEQSIISAKIDAALSYDACYGADADGNRGIPIWFVEHDWIVNSIMRDNGTKVDWGTLSSKQKLAVDAAVHAYAEAYAEVVSNNPENYEDDRDDRDYEEMRDRYDGDLIYGDYSDDDKIIDLDQ